MKQYMVESFISSSGRLDENIQVVLDQLLANILFEKLGTQITDDGKIVFCDLVGDNPFFVIHARDLNVSRSSSSTRRAENFSEGMRFLTTARAWWARIDG